MSIIDLNEISRNSWKALYQGNYGIYTIKIKTDGSDTIDFSCSCPSDYYPCKHIPIIEKAIKQRIAKNAKNYSEQKIKQLLKDLPQERLCDFIARQAKDNPQLNKAILLEFSFDYTLLLRNALDEFHYDYNDDDSDYSFDDYIEIDELDQWLDKAQEYVEIDNPSEAILICKACIEEYASWFKKQDDYIIENIDTSYQERPFYILEQILDMPNADYKDLLDYCKSEMHKPKYEGTEMQNGFNDLFKKLST